jgi:Serine/threonine protein kinase
VYLCEISEYDELVAYKEYSRRAKSYESLLEEFRLVHELDHENIVKYLYLQPPDINREFGIVMEYMAGGSLQTYVQENFHNITFEEKIYLAKQILLGLAYLHENNIIHGDMKV